MSRCKVFVDQVEIPGADVLLGDWIYGRRTIVVKNTSRFQQGNAEGYDVLIRVPIGTNNTLCALHKARKPHHEILVQIFADLTPDGNGAPNAQPIREIVFRWAVIELYNPMGPDEHEMMRFVTLTAAEITDNTEAHSMLGG